MNNKKLVIDVTLYDQNDFNKWRQSQDTIPQEIENHQQTVQINEEKLVSLERDLDALRPALAPIETRINQLQAQINTINNNKEIKSLRIKSYDLQTQIAREQKRLNDVKKSIAQYETVISHLGRQIDFKRLEEKINNLEVSKRTKSSEINNLQSELLSKNNELLALQQHINTLELKISSLRQMESSFKTSMQERDRLSMQPHDSGFKSSMQQDTHGFQSSMQQDTHGFQSSMQQDIQDFKSSMLQDTHGFKSSKGFKAAEEQSFKSSTPQPVPDHRQGRMLDEQQSRKMDRDLKNLKYQESQLKARIETINKNISSKQHDINTMTSDIGTCQNRLLFFSIDDKWSVRGQSLLQLQLELTNAMCDKRTAEQEKNQLDKTFTKLKNDGYETDRQIENLESKIKTYSSQRGDFSRIEDLNELNTLLDVEKQSSLIKQKKELSNEISQKSATVRQAKQQILALQKELHDLQNNHFLQRLQREPEQLINDLRSRTKDALNRFEEEYPAKQSDRVRLAMFEILTNLEALQNMPIYQSTYNLNLPDVLRQRYYQHCGLLWSNLNELTDEDHHLAKAIYSILKNHPIQTEFGMIQYDQLQFPKKDISEVNKVEERAYADARNDLLRLLKPYKSGTKDQQQLHKSGTALLDSIAEKKAKGQLNPGTLKFHMTILQTAAKLLQSPNDENLKKLFHHLIEESHEDSPVGKKILNALTTGFGLFAGKNIEVEKAASNFEKDLKNVKVFIPAVNPKSPQSTEEKVNENANTNTFFPAPSAPPLESNGEAPLYPDLANLKLNL